MKMLIKPRFRWKTREERTIFEIVSEDGVMRPREIFRTVRAICRLRGEGNSAGSPSENRCLHPRNIVLKADGSVQWNDSDLPLSAREAYIPPEQDRFDGNAPEDHVYALGMLMLFMATGHEKKGDLDTLADKSSLRSIIARGIAFDPRTRFRDMGELMGAVRRAGGGLRKTLVTLLVVAVLCLAAGLVFRAYREGKARGGAVGGTARYDAGYAKGYEKGFSDAPGIGVGCPSFDADNGNLSGNFAAEGGAFAARGERDVFFLSKGNIYRMDPYTKAVETLASGVGARGLNYYRGWLYFCTDEKVVRLDPKTMGEEVFCDSHTGVLYIVDGAFYLYDTGTGYLYRIDAATGALTQLNGSMRYRCLNIVGGRLYYIREDKGSGIYSCDLDGGNSKLISSNSCGSFCVRDARIYAAVGAERDALNDGADLLISMDLNGGNVERLVSISAYAPNATDAGVFYVAGSKRTLEWMSLDGKTRYTVVPTRTGRFNVAGRWIFYRNEEDGGNLWRVRIDGSGSARVEE